MLVDSSNSAAPSVASAASAVTGAIRQAAEATGASFHYLLATAQVESGLNPQAGASSSSARGLFQFIQQTWLATMKQAGAALGYGRYADAIVKNGSGQYEVPNSSLRSEILGLRNNPTVNAEMAGAFTKANAAILSGQLGRSPSDGELYIAHFLGAGGAVRLINLAESNPAAKASEVFSGAAQANPSIFYDRATGTARSVAQVRNILVARYQVAQRGQGPAPTVVTTATASATAAAPAAPATPPAPDTAGIADAFAAATTPTPAAHKERVFHGLFADRNGAAPLAPTVSALWGVPGATTATSAQKQAALSSGSMLDLFRDVPIKGT